jgi:transposase
MTVRMAAGDRAAASMYTIVQTAKFNGVNPRAYLRDTIEKVAGRHAISRVDELMPCAPPER